MVYQLIQKAIFFLLIISFANFHSFGQRTGVLELRQDIEKVVVRSLKDKDVISRLVLAKIQKSAEGVTIDYILTHENTYQQKIDSCLRKMSYKNILKGETNTIVLPLVFVSLNQDDLQRDVTAKLTLFELKTLLGLKKEKENEIILDPIIFSSFPERQ